MRIISWILLFLIVAGAAAASPKPEGIKVGTERLGRNHVKVVGEAVTSAPLERVWEVLTDYNHLGEFIPGLKKCWIDKQQQDWFLTQQGRAEWWIFEREMEVTFRVEETPPERIDFDAVAGDFKEYRGAWRVEPKNGHVQIFYEATIRPKFFMPPWLGRWLLQRQLRGSLEAIVKRAQSSAEPVTPPAPAAQAA